MPFTYTRVSNGLIFFEDFAALDDWSIGVAGGWTATELPMYVAYPVARMMCSPTVAGADAGGVREAHLMVEGSTWYLYYGAGDGANPWKVHLATSTNGGKTWTKQGVQVGYSKDFEAGDWAARDNLFAYKYGSYYYLHVVDAYNVSGVVPATPYETSIYRASSPEGPWTYLSRSITLGGVGDDDEVIALDSCLVYESGTETWHCFYTAEDGGFNYSIGRATASYPYGPWTKQGYPVTAAFVGEDAENAKVWWSAALNRWCMTVNVLDAAHTKTASTMLLLSESLTDWSAATKYTIQQIAFGGAACDIDTTQGDVVGILSAIFDEDFSPIVVGGYVPFTYDGYPDPSSTPWHVGRKILGGLLEPSRYCAVGTCGAGQNRYMRRAAAHSDVIIEFAYEVPSGSSGAFEVYYRRDNDGEAIDSGYNLSISALSGGGLRLYKVAGGANTAISDLVDPNLEIGRTHRVRIEAIGNSHKVYFEGVLLIDVTDATYASGAAFGLRVYQATVRVRNFHARTGSDVTVTGVGASTIHLRTPGGLYVTEAEPVAGTATLTHTHYPMGELADATGFEAFDPLIYGGDSMQATATTAWVSYKVVLS